MVLPFLRGAITKWGREGTSSRHADLMLMKKTIVLAALLWLSLLGSADAQQLTEQLVNTAPIEALPSDRPTTKDMSEPDPAVIRLQILLDRAGSSPGVIDGHYGENVHKSVAGFEAMQGLPVDGKLDAEVIRRLPKDGPAILPYVISKDDAEGLVESIPKDYARQATMKRLGYTSIAEKLAERFHMDIDLLKAMNPGSTFAVEATVLVAMPGDARTGSAKRIEVQRHSGKVLAFAKDGSLLSAYPATIGSEESPSPSGKHRVKGVARMPPYIYNPKVNFQQGKNTKVLKLPGGPNNPVGTVWIDLTEPTYGIHGTPEPSLIDKTGSHGCVRLTNWDAEELAAMVKPGVVVEFTN